MQTIPSEESKGGKLKEHTNEYRRAFAYKCPALYFNARVLGTKWIVDYVTDLFSLDINGLLADRYGTWALDWINNRQEKMLKCFDWQKNPKNTRVSRYCIIDDYVSDDFKFNGELGPMKQLWIRSNGHWVTCDNLMNFDCCYILIERSRLSISDLSSFLRHWRAGGSPRLEWLHLYFEKHTFQKMV
ncbi:hypothetical protein L3Y34_005551 [Caenorhabditis briggsae]|uniref:Sdz-33 F-box domain-containing protein n=1 Tax=Caenorhabditis briggsae TaxID=6238 RepID=A0AAE9D6F5_CAEBR|nr:hypothetical protein L3Y34_005551 [Caenorhabditis briggsae]